MSFLIKHHSRPLEFKCDSEQTLLQGAITANILIPHSCRAGQCGRCKSRVLSGDYFYPNGPHEAISDMESNQGLLLCCQAVPLTDMTIDSLSIEEIERGKRI